MNYHPGDDAALLHLVEVLPLGPVAADEVRVVLVEGGEVQPDALDVGLAQGHEEPQVDEAETQLEGGAVDAEIGSLDENSIDVNNLQKPLRNGPKIILQKSEQLECQYCQRKR